MTVQRLRGAATAIGFVVATTIGHAQDTKANEVLAEARAALGGEAKVHAVQALELTTTFRRVMAGDEVEGFLDLQIQRPDRLRITDEMSPIPGGPTMVRVQGLDGNEAWDDASTRGGGGGNIVMHMVGPGGDRPDDPAMNEARLRGRRADLQRYLAALLASPTAGVKYAGTAESEDGTADIIEIDGEGGQPTRLFVDRASHLPLMIAYTGRQPRVMVRRAAPGGPPNRGQMARDPARTGETPSPEVTIELRLGEHRSVDGLKLPFRITRSIDGAVVEEWTVEKYKVNPAFKAGLFRKK